ncbi:TRAP transporter substrate-binding protein DctP [Ruegeria atlantica]|uniref:TRAP transporter substrate-binding protein DctP n=1 Tax=Ruegeria atlantica TaxID=81569 RepID=UPI0024948347|nr:TRAP transporter substrate-binding protein DctP [Ruegeria atlantica]
MNQRLNRLARAVTFSVTLGATLAANTAAAEPVELIFNNFIPTAAPLYSKGLEPWAREVEAASNGTLKITIPTSSLAPPPRSFDIVEDGVADIAIAAVGFREKQFQLNMVSNIPLSAETTKGASIAAWETHQKFFADVGQWEELIPLTIFSLGDQQIFSNTHPIRSIEDFDGFKMMVEGNERTTTVQNLGASPVGDAGIKMFELISGGVADGIQSAVGPAAILGMVNATKHITVVPGGMGRSPFVIFINRERFEELPEDAQKALIETSGVKLAGKLGAILDGTDAYGMNKFKEAGIEVEDASAELINAITEASAHHEAAWIEQANSMGIDGTAAFEFFRKNAESNK